MENNTEKALLCKLRLIDFSLYETVLYLDAYPHDKDALAYYHKLLEQRKSLAKEYESSFGPITPMGNTCTTEWKWIKGPWPWEFDAN